MANKTQLRLNQISGSGLPSVVTVAQGGLNIGGADLSGSLTYFATAIANVHGNANWGNQAPGVFSHAIKPNSVGGQDIGSTGAEWGDVFIADDKDIKFGSDQDVTIGYDAASSDDLLLTPGGSSHIRIVGDNKELRFNGDDKGVAASGTSLAIKANGAVTISAPTGLIPLSDDGAPLGGASNNWSDLFLADSAVINLGDDQDVTLTHVPDAGLTLGGTKYLSFNDAGTKISSSEDGQLDIDADGIMEDAVKIAASAGGIELDAAAAKDVSISGGQVKLVSKDNATQAIDILTNQGTSETIQVTNTQGQSVEALSLKTEDGGMRLAAVYGNARGILSGSGNRVQLQAGSDAASAIHLRADGGTSATLHLQNLKSTDSRGIELEANAGGVYVGAGTTAHVVGGEAGAEAVLLDASDASGQVHLQVGGADKAVLKAASLELSSVDLDFMTDAKAILMGASDEFQIKHDNHAASGQHVVTTTEKLGLTGSQGVTVGGASVIISGSGVTSFKGGGIGARDSDGGTTFNFVGAPDPNSLLLTDVSATAAYKTNFCGSGDVSILGALNALNASVSATEPTLLAQAITGSVVGGVPKPIYATSIPSGGGTAAGFTTGPMAVITPAKVEVFVNGQALLSGSEAARAGGIADYHVNAPGFITFGFDLVAGDVVIVRDRT